MSTEALILGRERPRRWTLQWMISATRYVFIRVRTRLLLEAAIASLPRVPASLPVQYRFGDAGDLERLHAIDTAHDPSARDAAARQLARGDRLILGELDDRPIFHMWLAIGAIDTGTGRHTRPMSPTRAYSYKLHTAAPYRGRGVASGVYQFVAPTLSALGCTHLVCWVSDRNIASLRMHERAGFAVAGRLYEVRLFGCWQTYWWNRGLRRLLEQAAP